MKNYIASESGFFDIEHVEVNKLKMIRLTRENSNDVVFYLKETRGKSVDTYWLYDIPSSMKRSQYDNATLLVIQLTDGRLIAKRHNNSQHLRIK